MPSPWLAALPGTVLVPDGMRSPTLGRAAAAGDLGCRDDDLDALVAAGFPAADGVMFDPLDVINLGLAAGTGRSLAELAERRALKLAAGPEDSWVARQRCRVELTALRGDSGPDSGPDGGPGEHHAPPYRPDLASYGGELHSWTETGPGTAQAEVTTAGSRYEVTDPVARAAFHEVFDGLRDGAYRFAWLPAALRATPDAAIERAVMDCEIASVLVARRCADGGLTARTRVGFLIGLVGVEHCWTEVLLDGAWRGLDPLLAYLATRHPGSSPEFTEFCLGSTPSRRLAWAHPAGTALAPGGGPVTVRLRQIPATGGRP